MVEDRRGGQGGKKTGSTGRGSRVEKGGIRYPSKNQIKKAQREEKDSRRRKKGKAVGESSKGEEGKEEGERRNRFTRFSLGAGLEVYISTQRLRSLPFCDIYNVEWL